MSIQFHDFSADCKNFIEEQAIAWLHEAAGEVEAEIKRQTPDRGRWFTELEQSWKHTVDEGKLEATIGSNLERALWSEFGTGEFSIAPKGGRQGYWVYVKDNGSGDSGGYTYKGGKQYTLEEAKGIVAMMRADGLDAWYTKGQRPNRTMQKSYTKMKPKLIKRAKELFK